jgi:non-ribosomal peptide synthetase-like protein
VRVARAAIEAGRLLPIIVTVAVGVAVVGVLELAWLRLGLLGALLLGAVALAAAGVVAGATAAIAKWLLVGRIRAREHPLWSSFVWRNELADTFVEVLAAPWLLEPCMGSPIVNVWLRAMGARVGRGVWCETYWLPEYDLVRLGDGATVNRGCVVQTHLFHDRIMSLDTVTLGNGATLGPHGVILPAAALGAASTVGPASLVMRGEAVPAASRWSGNPIAPWAPTKPNRSATQPWAIAS